MDWFVYTLASSTAATVTLAIAFYILYRESGERYLIIWSLSWVTSTLRYVFLISASSFEDTTYIFAGGQAVSLTSAFLFLYGTFGFLERRMPLWLYGLFSLNILWTASGIFWNPSLVIATLPNITFACLVYIFTGITFIGNKQFPGAGKNILGWALVLWGIDKAAFPFIVMSPTLRPWDSIAVNAIIFMAAYGLLITYFQKAREALRYSQMNYRRLIEGSTDAIFLLFDGKFVYVNPKFQEIFGLTSDEIDEPGFDFLDHVHPSSRELFKARISMSDPNSDPAVPYEFMALDKDGSELVFEVSESWIRYEDGYAKQGILRNITERKKAEEERQRFEENLYRVQKMESIGRLAGGVAHDFNNILSGMMGYAELLKLNSPDPETSDGEAVDVILKGSERAAELTKQLLGFARGGKYNPVPVNINEAVKNVVAVSGKIFKKQVEVEYTLDEDVYIVEVDHSQLDQVITNILINARDAMPDGGTLTIKTENVSVAETTHTKTPGLSPGSYVRLSISDTGIGIPSEIRDKVFEPFFTTKGDGKGTGLGLATVYGIIKNHGGHVTVEDRSVPGTTLVIYLPESKKELPTERPSPKPISGEGTVLVIDDEPHVLGVVSRMLDRLGYTVLTADDGERGVEMYADHGDEIDIVLLDMVMPRMGGKETFKRLVEIDPSVTVILSSGYSGDDGANEVLQAGAVGFVQKPVKLAELSKVMASVIR